MNSVKAINPLQLTARIISAVMVAFALSMFIGETIEGLAKGHSEPMTWYSIFQLILFGIGLLGLVIAWKWEMAGGIISVLSFIILFIVNPAALVALMIIFPATAILFIVSAYQHKL
jgi:hypothetical protein